MEEMTHGMLAVCLAATAGTMAAAPPDFAHDIAPLVYQHCVSCHHPGGTGPFSLVSYTDARKRAGQIAAVTRIRYMPPWLPEAGYGDFTGENRLTDAQIRLIEEWVAAGAPEGPAGQVPAPPQSSDGWQLGRPDLILEAKDSLTVPASGPKSSGISFSRPMCRGSVMCARSRFVPAIRASCIIPT
jgi:mono/diheme cytochrome c family protein